MSPWVSQGGAEALVRGEEGDEVEAEAEVVGTAVRRVAPVAHPGADLEGLAADGEELVDPEVYRDRRLLRGPVIGRLCVEDERRRAGAGVVPAALQEVGVDLAEVVVAGEGLDLFGQDTLRTGATLGKT